MLKPLGQLFVRVGLLITDKGKQGREHTVFTLQEIQQAFLEGVGEAVGKRIVFDEWASTGSSQESAKPPPKSRTTTLPTASLSDHNSPIWIAGHSGFSIGTIVVQKFVEASPEGMFEILSIGEKVELHQVCSYSLNLMKITISLDDLLTHWAPTKADLPFQMEGGQRRPKTLDFDRQKALLFKALVELDAKHLKHELIF